MKRFMLLAAMCGALVLTAATIALAQTVQTAPNNPDGTCPEGFVQVNAPFCAQESPNTPGRVFGFGEGDPVTPPATLAGQSQYDPAADCSTQAAINANPFGCFVPTPETVGSEFTAATTQDDVNRGLTTQEAACQQPVYLASIFAANCDGAAADTPSESGMTATTTSLPATGGPSLALIAGALLVGAGLVLRRR